MTTQIYNRPIDQLFITLCSLFSVIVVLSNIISSKLIDFEMLNITLPAGLITYPLTFVLSDFITEVYGSRNAKLMVRIALGMSLINIVIIYATLKLPSKDIVIENSFRSVFGTNTIIIAASLTAYFISQSIDISLYEKIKKITGSKHLWLRNNVSTLTAQIADTVIVNSIHLGWGLGLEPSVVMKAMIFSYFYKGMFSLIDTPLLYFALHITKRYRINC